MSKNGMVEISDHEIRVRAYKIWEKKGKPDGCADEHWREALAELTAEHAAKDRPVPQVPARPSVSSRPSRTASRAISKSIRG